MTITNAQNAMVEHLKRVIFSTVQYGPGYLGSKDGVASLWHFVVNLDIRLTLLSYCISILVPRCGCKGQRFKRSVSQLRISLSAFGAKKVSWPWLSLLQRWGSLTMEFVGKFSYIWLTILSCCCSILGPCCNWRRQ